MSVNPEPELEEEEDEDEEIETEVEDVSLSQTLALVDIKYNDFEMKSYLKYKFPVPDHVSRYERRFLEDVDTIRYGHIKREVYKVIRCRAQDKDGKTKDYLYYMERWTGNDYLGNELTVPEHCEGKYDEVLVNYGVDERGKPKKSEPKIKSKVTRYYIPFKKSTLDKILKDVEKDSVIYLVKIGSGKPGGDTRRDDSFSYHQFANATYTELITLSYQAGGPRRTPEFPPTTTPVKK